MANLSPWVMSDLELLQNLYGEIYDAEEEIFALEAFNRKGSIEFKELVNEIKHSKQLASNIEDRLNTSNIEIKSIIHYLYGILGIKVSKAGVYSIVSTSRGKEDTIKARIVNRLVKKYFEEAPEYLANSVVDGVSERMDIEIPSDISDKISRDLSNSMNFGPLYATYASFDIPKLVIAIIDKEKNNLRTDISIFLLKKKYDFGFLIEEIENEFLENGFNTNEHPFLNVGSVNQMYPVPAEIEMTVKSMVFTPIIDACMTTIEGLDDSQTGLKSFEFCDAVFNMYYLRAVLVMLDEEGTERMIKEIGKKVAKLMSMPGKSVAAKLLKEAISHRKNDLEVPLVVSVGR